MLNITIDEKRFTTTDGVERLIVKDFSLALEQSSFTTLLGPSGCGKSTTLRIIMGLDNDYSGTITPDPNTIRLAAVFQEPTLLPWRTVEQNIRLCSTTELSDSELHELLSRLEIEHTLNYYPGELSVGMARRVALARAFALKPDLLLLDEPFVSLDEAMAERLRQYLKSLYQTFQPTVLMVSHNEVEARELSNRIITLTPNPMRIEEDLRL